VVHVSAVVWAEGILLRDSNTNELFIYKFGNGYEQTGILIPGLHKCVAVSGYTK
jgi:hypothetical protein